MSWFRNDGENCTCSQVLLDVAADFYCTFIFRSSTYRQSGVKGGPPVQAIGVFVRFSYRPVQVFYKTVKGGRGLTKSVWKLLVHIMACTCWRVLNRRSVRGERGRLAVQYELARIDQISLAQRIRAHPPARRAPTLRSYFSCQKTHPQFVARDPTTVGHRRRLGRGLYLAMAGRARPANW